MEVVLYHHYSPDWNIHYGRKQNRMEPFWLLLITGLLPNINFLRRWMTAIMLSGGSQLMETGWAETQAV